MYDTYLLVRCGKCNKLKIIYCDHTGYYYCDGKYYYHFDGNNNYSYCDGNNYYFHEGGANFWNNLLSNTKNYVNQVPSKIKDIGNNIKNNYNYYKNVYFNKNHNLQNHTVWENPISNEHAYNMTGSLFE